MKKIIGILTTIVFLAAFMFFLPSNTAVNLEQTNLTADESDESDASDTSDTSGTDANSNSAAPAPSSGNTSPNSQTSSHVQTPTPNKTSNQTSNQTASQPQTQTATPTPTPTQAQTTPSDPTPSETPSSPEVSSLGQTSNASATSTSADQQHMLDLVNAERGKLGVAPLTLHAKLSDVAQLKAEDMVNNSYFSHTSPTYGSPFDMLHQFGVSYRYAGENLSGNSSVDRAHTAFMNSEGHRANILNANYDEIGIGMIASPKYGYVFVQIFIGS